MPLLWLASVQHRGERSGLGWVALGESGKRRRLVLPANLADKFERCGLSQEFQNFGEDGKGRFQVLGLVDVEPGEIWDSISTCWPQEALALKTYFEEAADAYSIRVRRAFMLQVPQASFGCIGTGGKAMERVRVPVFRPVGFEYQSSAGWSGRAPHGDLITVAEIARRWGYRPVDIDSAQMFACVEPVAKAVLQGCLKSL